MFEHCLANVRKQHPLIHNITNYVTVNDVANVLLAIGASPIMADDQGEVEEITSLCAGLNINIGTLNQRTISAMKLAGQTSNALGHVLLLDPVGAGASSLRTQTAKDLLASCHFTAIRGNISEIKTLALGLGKTQGVDASLADSISSDNLPEAIAFAQAFSKKTGAVIAITGAIDLVCDAHQALAIYNGHPMMSRITGTGCQLSALTTAFLAANPDQAFEAVAASVMTMGLAGELAYQRLDKLDGNATYRNYIIDAIYHMTPEQLKEGARYERF